MSHKTARKGISRDGEKKVRLLYITTVSCSRVPSKARHSNSKT